MPEGLVRVEQVVNGRRERTWVSADQVEEYLQKQPGAHALDHDWREQAMKLRRPGSAAAEKKGD